MLRNASDELGQDRQDVQGHEVRSLGGLRKGAGHCGKGVVIGQRGVVDWSVQAAVGSHAHSCGVQVRCQEYTPDTTDVCRNTVCVCQLTRRSLKRYTTPVRTSKRLLFLGPSARSWRRSFLSAQVFFLLTPLLSSLLPLVRLLALSE